jgi:hypothetical protein
MLLSGFQIIFWAFRIGSPFRSAGTGMLRETREWDLAKDFFAVLKVENQEHLEINYGT